MWKGKAQIKKKNCLMKWQKVMIDKMEVWE